MHSKLGTAYEDISKEKKQMSRLSSTKTSCTVNQDIHFVKVDLKTPQKLLHPSICYIKHQNTQVTCCKSYKPHLTFHLQD